MKEEHFSDDRIQEILDDMAHGPGRPLPAHLAACPSCRERFAQYRNLYAGLVADPGFTLPPAFAEAVLRRLPAERPVFWARPAVRISLAAGLIALATAGIALWVNLSPLVDQVARLAASMVGSFRPLPAQFRQLLAQWNGVADWLVLGGLGLLGAAFFDRILQRQALRRSH
ncbi:MAG TPA: hypothetical protein VLQ89_00150 [Candidatus Binatia bacterium]|nr:hypothetical protein [Candidatus Binatia bacterium]